MQELNIQTGQGIPESFLERIIHIRPHEILERSKSRKDLSIHRWAHYRFNPTHQSMP
jgi:hypothetical protein